MLHHLLLLAFVCIILWNAGHQQGNAGNGHPPMIRPGMGPVNGHGGPSGQMGGPNWPMGGPHAGKGPNGGFPHMNGHEGPESGPNGGPRH